MEQWRRRLGTNEKGSSDPRAGRPEGKRRRDPASAGDTAGGDHGHADCGGDLRHQGKCAGLRGGRAVTVRIEKRAPMSAGFAALSNDRIYATRFKPAHFVDRRR